MKPVKPEEKAATAPAAPPAAAAVPTDDTGVAGVTADLRQFRVAEGNVSRTQEQQAAEREFRVKIIQAFTTHHNNFEAFKAVIERFKRECDELNIHFNNVCSDTLPGKLTLIEHAIKANCPVDVLKELAQYGAPINFIDSKKPAIEVAWKATESPHQQEIIAWLLESDPYEPKATWDPDSNELVFEHDCLAMRTISGLNAKFPSPELYTRVLRDYARFVARNTPGFVCPCGNNNPGCVPGEITTIIVSDKEIITITMSPIKIS